MPFEPEDFHGPSKQLFQDDSYWSPSNLLYESATMCTFTDKMSVCHNKWKKSSKDQATVYWGSCNDPENSNSRSVDERFDTSSLDRCISMALSSKVVDRPISVHCRRARAVLTAQQACEIYNQKIRDKITDTTRPNCVENVGTSVSISQNYGVSPKAVRDIWNR